jgi:hypothetical protein
MRYVFGLAQPPADYFPPCIRSRREKDMRCISATFPGERLLWDQRTYLVRTRIKRDERFTATVRNASNAARRVTACGLFTASTVSSPASVTDYGNQLD